jgi:disulfide bond formation protein DsbB
MKEDSMPQLPPWLEDLTARRIYPLAIGVGSAALLLGALGFQYIGEIMPCVLCLYQRIPHVAGIVLMLIAYFVSPRRGRVYAAVFLAAAIVYYIDAAMAGYHVGVEYKWWPGPDKCSATNLGAKTLEELQAEVMATKPVRCDEVQWRMFGLSMAAYNFIFCLLLADAAMAAFVYWWRRGRGEAK